MWRAIDATGLGAAVVLAACGVVCALVAARAVDPARPAWLAVSLAAVATATAAVGVGAYRASGSLLRLLVSPFSLAAATWLVLFVWRPLELYVAPEHAARGLAQLGFGPADLTRTVALAGLGCAAWGVGYLLGLGGPRRRGVIHPSPGPLRVSTAGAALALAAGAALWAALFVRQGGLGALVDSAASIRVNQLASFYGFVGVWIVQGVVLYALLAVLRGRARGAWLVLAAGLPLVALAAAALQLRLLAALAVISGVSLYAANRGLSRWKALVLGCAAIVGALALAFFQQVREYSIWVPTREAVSLTMKTPLDAAYVSDLSTYDHFVAMQALVPGSIGYLHGQTIAEIPQAFVPRSLWPGKPLGVDFLTSSYLYPGDSVAVPISIQGELYWNGGLPGVVLGALVLGVVLGLLARFGLAVAPRSELFLLYAVAYPFTHAFLTRGLATMLQNLTFALVGLGIAIVAMNPPIRARVIDVLRALGRGERPRWRTA